MVPTEDKKDKSKPPDNSLVEHDRQILRDLGAKLSTSYKDAITVLEIKRVADSLTEIHNKYQDSLDDKSNKFWNIIQGRAMFLSDQNAKTYKDFYVDALELGRKIKQLAEKLGSLAIPILIGGETLSFYG
jgi:hypothetical protein